MTQARIRQPAPNAMQTGPSSARQWVLDYDPGAPKEIDPLMGWVGSADTQSQVRLKFRGKSQAVAYAKRKGLSYRLEEPNERRFIIKNYADNFSFK
ncbi:MAG TPA: ETC complex I subunit [Rhodospirillales bacterium]|nr:ETC complex I subunit [Rhodospirillales bacterium]